MGIRYRHLEKVMNVRHDFDSPGWDGIPEQMICTDWIPTTRHYWESLHHRRSKDFRILFAHFQRTRSYAPL